MLRLINKAMVNMSTQITLARFLLFLLGLYYIEASSIGSIAVLASCVAVATEAVQHSAA